MALGVNGGNGRKRKRLIWGGAALGLVVLLSVVLVAARGSGKEIDPSKLAKVERGDIARSVVATGKIQPLTKVEVKSKSSGIVKSLFVHYGDRIRKGQVLAELDKEDLEAQVREARATLLAAEAAYERNKVEVPDRSAQKGRRQVAVKLGIANGVKAEVAEGLKEGDQVVLQ